MTEQLQKSNAKARSRKGVMQVIQLPAPLPLRAFALHYKPSYARLEEETLDGTKSHSAMANRVGIMV